MPEITVTVARDIKRRVAGRKYRGDGNVPPVSPPQGNPGATSTLFYNEGQQWRRHQGAQDQMVNQDRVLADQAQAQEVFIQDIQAGRLLLAVAAAGNVPSAGGPGGSGGGGSGGPSGHSPGGPGTNGLGGWRRRP